MLVLFNRVCIFVSSPLDPIESELNWKMKKKKMDWTGLDWMEQTLYFINRVRFKCYYEYILYQGTRITYIRINIMLSNNFVFFLLLFSFLFLFNCLHDRTIKRAFDFWWVNEHKIMVSVFYYNSIESIQLSIQCCGTIQIALSIIRFCFLLFNFF